MYNKDCSRVYSLEVLSLLYSTVTPSQWEVGDAALTAKKQPSVAPSSAAALDAYCELST